MWIEARDIDEDAVLEADLCIVGAGAAGIALAMQFVGRGERVILLEGGGTKRKRESVDVYAGRCDDPLADGYLTGSRLRQFGGTTNHWLGACLTLDPIDFEARDWVDGSGWPFGREVLDPYYVRAARELVDVDPPPDPDAPIVAGAEISTKRARGRAVRFAEAFRPPLESASNVRVVIEASVVRVALAPEGRRVDHLEVAALGTDRRFRTRARAYVLAAGAIENARLLLVSDDVHPAGVGNEHDLVGRYFQDHAIFPVAEICVTGPDDRLARRGPKNRVFRLGDDAQRRRRLLNCIFDWNLVPRVEDAHRQLLAAGAWRRLERYLEARDALRHGPIERLDEISREPPGLHWRRFDVRPEQAPDRESRVMLGDDRDAFGNRRTHLSWKLSRQSIESARESALVLARELGRTGLGRLKLDLSGFDEKVQSPGFHHMGTTRMHADPRLGVVDPQGKVHGLADLWIAGSSVFPTSGAANPTFTILALALRLADRLREVLAKGGP